jgi:acyl-CoA carboxylase subunit beta
VRPAAVAEQPRLGARELIGIVLYPGTFASRDLPVAQPAGASPTYWADLVRAREVAETDEAVLTGRGDLDGRPAAVVVSEFGFLGGTIGVACAQLGPLSGPVPGRVSRGWRNGGQGTP